MITLKVSPDVAAGWFVFELDGVAFAPMRPVGAVDGDLVIALSGRESSLLRHYGVRGAIELQGALRSVDPETLIVLLAISMHRAGNDKALQIPFVEKLLDGELKLVVLMGADPDEGEGAAADPGEGVAAAELETTP